MENATRILVGGKIKRWHIIPDIGPVTVVSGSASVESVLVLAEGVLKKMSRKASSVRIVQDTAFLIKEEIAAEGEIPETLLSMGVGNKVSREYKEGTLEIKELSDIVSPFIIEIGSKDSGGLGKVDVKSVVGRITTVWCTPTGHDTAGNVVLQLKPKT